MSPALATLFFLSLVPPTPAQDPASDSLTAPERYFEALQQANGFHSRGEWARSVPLYEALVERFPLDEGTWRRLAVGHYSLRNYPEAIAALEEALALGTRAPARSRRDLAACYALVGDGEAAFAALEASLGARLEDRGGLARADALRGLRGDGRWTEATGALPAEVRDRDAGWRYDVEFLVREARRLHAAPGRQAFSDRFARRAEELVEALPDLTDDQVLAEMMLLAAALEDGHSVVYGPDPDTPLAFDGASLPFKFYLFPDGLYVVDGHGEWTDHSGSRVVSFGDVPAEEVLERMAAYRGVDNPMTWTWMGPQFYVRRVGLLREVGAAQAGAPVELVLATPEGEETRIRVEGGDYPLVRKLRPSPAATGETPLYLTRVDANYWMTPLADHVPHTTAAAEGALYLQFNQVRDDARESLAAFSARLREELATGDYTTLVVDVRHNNGGNNGLLRPLVRALVEFDASPEHRVFVVTGRNTFSAAQNFINRVERLVDAVFVGEPSSSSPNFTGEESDVLLPYSRLRASISSRYWQDSDPGDDRPWIAPHVPVELTAEEYFTGVDPALEAILSVLSAE